MKTSSERLEKLIINLINNASLNNKAWINRLITEDSKRYVDAYHYVSRSYVIYQINKYALIMLYLSKKLKKYNDE